MKNNLHFMTIAVLALLVVSSVMSCQKDNIEAGNPPADNSLVSAPFTLSALEDRGAYGKLEWTIDKNGNTDSVSENLDEMTVTSVNKFTFTVKPEGSGDGFTGVNVKSSNTSVVMPTIVSKKEFTLKYVGDGEATITVWNGNESGKTSFEFKVVSRLLVEPEALRFEVDGKIIDIKTCYDTEKEARTNRQCILNIPKEEARNWLGGDTPIIHKVVFLGLLPENCSYDMVSIHPGIEYEKEWKDWLIEHGYDKEEFFPEEYAYGGALSKLIGKVSYNACGYGSNPFKANMYEESEFERSVYPDRYETCFKVSVRRNSTYMKYYACYIQIPNLQKIDF